MGLKEKIELVLLRHKQNVISTQKAIEDILDIYNVVVSNSVLLSTARQIRLEQQLKIDSYTEHYNEYQIGTLNGIDRIVKLIELTMKFN